LNLSTLEPDVLQTLVNLGNISGGLCWEMSTIHDFVSVKNQNVGTFFIWKNLGKSFWPKQTATIFFILLFLDTLIGFFQHMDF